MPEPAEVLANQAMLQQTEQHGFLAPATIAMFCGLEERLIVALLERLGGAVHLPDFAEAMAEPPEKALVATLEENGTYVLTLRDLDEHGA